MEVSLKNIFTLLKEAGCRYSRTREFMVKILWESKHPLSYFDLQKLLKKRGIQVNKTTVYRELALLVKHGIAKELRFQNLATYYEIVPHSHHHHVVCSNCQLIDHIQIKENLALQEDIIAKHTNFKVLSHSLEFYGLCNACALNE